MFSENIYFQRNKRIDFRDHRRWAPIRRRIPVRESLSGLGQGTGIEELEYQAPLSVAPIVPPPSTFLQSITSLFNPAMNVAAQYLTLRQTQAVAAGQAVAVSRFPSGYPTGGAGFIPQAGGIPWGTVLLGGGVLVAGYFILSGRSKRR
jgi:hypothetical protein